MDASSRKLDNRDGVGRGNRAVVPSWLKSKNDGLSRYRNAENDSTPQYEIRLSAYNLLNKKIRRMPITTINK